MPSSARGGRSRSSERTNPKRFQAKWVPVRVKKTRQKECKLQERPRQPASSKNKREGISMSTAARFDFAPLLPAGLPAPAARWTGLAKYSFIGGNNDPDQVPVDALIEAINNVLRREGKTLATYGLASGPQGYRPLRDFLVT